MKHKAIIFFLLAAFAVGAETVQVSDCVRSADLDVWAASDAKFCQIVMSNVFKAVGLEMKRPEFGADNRIVVSNVEVICSAFRTERLVQDYSFPLQPLDKMHYALYTTPDKAMSMTSTRISEWPRMRVGYSPVSQGDGQDRQRYFTDAQLSPEYVEYSTSAGAVQALRNGEIDVLFLYTPFGKRPKGLVEVVPIGARNVYFAVRKDRPELMQRLVRAYREYYIDHIDQIDVLRAELLGVPKPPKRVRVAAYMRGDLFNVAPDGEKSGSLEMWMKSLCSATRWTPDFVYGGYDESIADVKSGRLDMIGGLGFDASRRDDFLFPHTPKIKVSDTGCGISESKMDRLFDPFVQDIASRMNASGGEMKGTGLGLPIVKRMVDNAQGTVKATSLLGKGTSFEIVIPNLGIVEGVSSAARSAAETIRSAMPDRVLVVDDMAMNRKILGIHLGNLKIKDIRYAENGEDALNVMKEWIPDLVLSDMWMPKMDGSQLAEAMRKERRLAEIPIVAVTADVDVGSTYDMSLFAKVIAKPVTSDKLRALFGDIGSN